MRRILLSVLPLLLFSAIVTAQKGYRIEVDASGLKEATIKLAFHLGNMQYVKDSIVTDGDGRCVFKGSESLPAGIYMIVLPDNRYIEFLSEKDQFFKIICNASDLAESISFKGSELNNNFLKYQRGWKILQEKALRIQDSLKLFTNDKEEYGRLKAEYLRHEEKMKSWLSSEKETNAGNLLGTIIKTLIPVQMPADLIPVEYMSNDSIKRLWSYIYYKDHFFDNTDLSNPGLIRTPILGSKLEQFFSQVVIQSPDSINKEADKLIARCQNQNEVYQYVTSWIFNKYTTSAYMGHDAIVVHLADSIYLSGKAPWISEEFKADLAKRVKRIKPNLIGNSATDLVMDSFSGQYVSLYDIRSEYTILYFWEPDCGHCKEATPRLKKFYDENKGSVEVFAICTTDDRQKWERYITDNNLDWINGWDPARISHFDFYYNVESTPLIYILDRNKKIIAKKLGVENIGPFIKEYNNYLRLTEGSSSR